jgi:hypothetical protein
MKIVQTRRYLKDMKRIGASASDIASLEETIATNPTVGDVIPGWRAYANFGSGSPGAANAAAEERSIFCWSPMMWR